MDNPSEADSAGRLAVLHHVANDACAVEVAPAAFHAFALCDRHLSDHEYGHGNGIMTVKPAHCQYDCDPRSR